MTFAGLSDELLGGIIPVVAYWLYSGMYVVFEPYLEKYKIHPKGEEEEKNIATKLDVVKGCLIEQAIQFAFVLLMFMAKGGTEVTSAQPSIPITILQLLVAMFILDSWQYFMHRALHSNKFMYKHIHSIHHRQIVTYPYGAQYNHPVEGFLLDTVGPALGYLASGMTPRTAIFFYTLATVKGVDDHAGYWIPWNPFQFLFQNNIAFHDVHHQLYGLKYNFATPFFLIWDRILGTHLPCEVVPRKEGGYEVVPLKQH